MPPNTLTFSATVAVRKLVILNGPGLSAVRKAEEAGRAGRIYRPRLNLGLEGGGALAGYPQFEATSLRELASWCAVRTKGGHVPYLWELVGTFGTEAAWAIYCPHCREGNFYGGLSLLS